MINRKQFIARTTLAATGLLLDAYAQPLTAAAAREGFQLKILGTDWGFPGSLDEYGAKVKAAGYDGIEIWWSLEQARQDAVFAMLKKYGLEVGFLCGAYEEDPAEHFEHFKKMVEGAARNTRQRPLYINCHSGRDFFSFEDNKKFIDCTTAISKETGVKILHETHRSRILFAAPVARRYLEAIPELRITLDVSHWCNVSESLLADQPKTVSMALERAEHIHARIGHPEGPQVSDPRAPEWQPVVEAHFAWWDVILRRKKERGEAMTILTEFGPPDYMPTLPYSHNPVADQWAINTHMLQILRKRYA
ncbi:MAG TPA: TIM barrel protein [Puia sp.]|nr:TIM barrel protein [Puia sp.]